MISLSAERGASVRGQCAARMTGSEDCSADHGNSTEASRALRLSGRVAASRAPGALSEGGIYQSMGGLRKLAKTTANQERKARGESIRAGWCYRARMTSPGYPSCGVGPGEERGGSHGSHTSQRVSSTAYAEASIWPWSSHVERSANGRIWRRGKSIHRSWCAVKARSCTLQ